MTPEPLDPATEALIASHLADPALVREIIAGHVIGYGYSCLGLAADGRCHCADAPEEDERPA